MQIPNPKNTNEKSTCKRIKISPIPDDETLTHLSQSNPIYMGKYMSNWLKTKNQNTTSEDLKMGINTTETTTHIYSINTTELDPLFSQNSCNDFTQQITQISTTLETENTPNLKASVELLSNAYLNLETLIDIQTILETTNEPLEITEPLIENISTNAQTQKKSFANEPKIITESVIEIILTNVQMVKSGLLTQNPFGLIDESFLVIELPNLEIGFEKQRPLKIMQWNLNSLNKRLENPSFLNYLKQGDFDLICFSETKFTLEKFKKQKVHEVDFWGKSHSQYWAFSTKKKGYSGVGVISKQNALSVQFGFDSKIYDTEGRSVTLEFANFFLVNLYVPCTKPDTDLQRYHHWDALLYSHIEKLKALKQVVVVGDFNVILTPFDAYDYKKAGKYPCVTVPMHQDSFNRLLAAGFKDTFRELHPKKKSFTWWDARFHQRDIDHGLRLDFCLVNDDLMDKVQKVEMASQIMGSDHCPIEIVITLGK